MEISRANGRSKEYFAPAKLALRSHPKDPFCRFIGVERVSRAAWLNGAFQRMQMLQTTQAFAMSANGSEPLCRRGLTSAPITSTGN